MKRRLLIIAVFLALGATVNVVVAWSCALWRPLERYDAADGRGWASGERAESILRVKFAGDAQTRNHTPSMRTDRGFGWTSSSGDVDLVAGRVLLSAGWRCRAARGEALVTLGPVVTYINSWPAPNAPFTESLIPLCPIWPGFLANTFLCAAVPWLCMRRVVALRRFLRLRRGLCPKCAYPMRESAVCTECGKALAGRA